MSAANLAAPIRSSAAALSSNTLKGLALTAGYFGRGQSKQSRALYHAAPPLRSGSLRSGAFQARAAYDLLRKSTSRAFGYAEGCCAPGPPDACAQPPEVAKLRAAPELAQLSLVDRAANLLIDKAKAKAILRVRRRFDVVAHFFTVTQLYC